jgi:hypothetical protein
MFLNPSYRVFEIDSNSKFPVDYIQYKFNLTLANSQPDITPIWEVRYRATQLYNVTNLTELKLLKNFIDTLDTNKENYLKVVSAFFTEGPLYNLYVDKKGK